MKSRFISEDIKYIGADDPELDIFEGQYELEAGMCYNSYIIKDEKIVVMDTIDSRKSDEWMNKRYIGIDVVALQSSTARKASNNHNFYHLDAYDYTHKFEEEFERLFPKGYIGYADVGHEKLNLTRDHDIKYVDYTYGIVIYD
jgi:hypothetical protein